MATEDTFCMKCIKKIILGSLLKNSVTITLPLLFKTVVVTLNCEKVTRYRLKVRRYFSLYMRPHVYYAIFK